MSNSPSGPPRLTSTQWLIVSVAALGFAFDIYELLMLPLIARPALAELLNVDQFTSYGQAQILKWTGYIMWGSAISGGIFGLIGGYLTDRFGRRRVLMWSIMVYALSPVAAAFSTTPEMLLLFRCTTFIGVCVEFVAAVAWLAELFQDPKQREAVLGYTQAFSSIGGLLVTGAFWFINQYAAHFPAIYGEHAIWRYMLISGLIPAIPLLLLYPLLPESPVWLEKRAKGTLKRAGIGEVLKPAYRKTTLVSALIFACSYGAAFGALQLTPQIVPGLIPEGAQAGQIRKQIDQAEAGSEQQQALKKQIRPLLQAQNDAVSKVQLFQEIGGLLGRFALAFLAIRIVSRRTLLRMFQVPGLIIFPLLYFTAAAGNLGENSLAILKGGIFVAGFLTVAQFSFWGNLPRVYPTHLRGTGEGFAANVGGRMFGTAANPMATMLAPWLLANMDGLKYPANIAYAAGIVALLVYLVGFIASFWLPEPAHEELPE